MNRIKLELTDGRTIHGFLKDKPSEEKGNYWIIQTSTEAENIAEEVLLNDTLVVAADLWLK